MKAAILVAQNAPLVVADIEPNELEPGQVLVDVRASGICGKQLEELDGRRGRDPYIPHLLGHEGAGVVREVGPGVRKVRPGDHVVLHWMKGCGIDSATPTFCWGSRIVNAGGVTTFSDVTVVSENRVTPIPRDVPFDIAALLGCAVTTGLGIVNNNLALRPAQSVVVFGVGGVGFNVVQAAMLVSADPIVAVDLYDHKLNLAMKFGATHVLNARRLDLEKALRGIAPSGFDGAVDVTGNVDVRRLAYDVTSNTGTTVFAGVPHQKDKLGIDSFPLHFGRRVVGSHGGDTRPDIDIPRAVRLYQRGRLNLRDQITHRFLLERVNEAIETVRKGDAGRCLLTFPRA